MALQTGAALATQLTASEYEPSDVASRSPQGAAAAPSRADKVDHSRISTLDGLRGLAVLMVVAFHYRAFNGLGSGGVDSWIWGVLDSAWMGVDLFFVLSGFLITGILADSRGGAHYFRNFYVRRGLRIMPLYFLVLAFLMWGMPRVTDALHLSLAATRPIEWWMYWTYLANIEEFVKGIATTAPLGVMWSLSIEEQFYLVWPLTVLLLSRRSMLMLCGAILVAEPLARLGLVQVISPAAIHVFTFTHLDGLAVGAAISLAVREPRLWALLRRLAKPVAVFGTLAVAGIVARVSVDAGSAWMDEVKFSVMAVTFGGILVLALTAQPSALLARALNMRLLQSVGRYSYAIYLFHQIVGQSIVHLLQRLAVPTVFGSFIPGAVVMMLIAGSISFGLAWLSWHVYEGPILALKRYFPADSSKRATPVAVQTLAITEGHLVGPAAT